LVQPTVTAEVLAASKRILSKEGADLSVPSSVIERTEGLLQQMEEDLKPRLGKAAFRSILQLSHQRAVKDHPTLEQLILEPNTELSLGEPVPTAPETEGDLSLGMIRLLAEVLVVVRQLARDQDWDQADLWFGLRELDQAEAAVRPSDVG
jgi:hypothetical protein